MLKQRGENYHQVKDWGGGREGELAESSPRPEAHCRGRQEAGGAEERYHQPLLSCGPFRRVQVGASLAFCLAYLMSCTPGISVRQESVSQGPSASAGCSR